MALIDFIPLDPSAFIKNSPNADTRRVFGRILYTDDTATTVPPQVRLTGFPVYLAKDEANIYSRPFNATLLDPTGQGNLAGIWYADIPVYEDPDMLPNKVWATISHPDWPNPETRRVLSSAPPRIRWVDLEIIDPTTLPVPTGIVWIGGSGGTTYTNYSQVQALTGYPAAFPPASHEHSAQDIQGGAEWVQDIVAAFFKASTGIDLAYDDPGNTLIITNTGSGGGGTGTVQDAESIRDAIGAALIGVGNITVTPNDAADTIVISTSATANSTDAFLRNRSNHTGVLPDDAIPLNYAVFVDAGVSARPSVTTGRKVIALGGAVEPGWLLDDDLWIASA